MAKKTNINWQKKNINWQKKDLNVPHHPRFPKQQRRSAEIAPQTRRYLVIYDARCHDGVLGYSVLGLYTAKTVSINNYVCLYNTILLYYIYDLPCNNGGEQKPLLELCLIIIQYNV